MSFLLIGLAVLASLPLMGWAVQGVGSTLDRLRYPAPGRLVQVGGHKLHAFETSPAPGIGGEGITVVFEAGIGASSLSWRRVQPEVAPFFRTLAYDRAGLGWSEAATPVFQGFRSDKGEQMILERNLFIERVLPGSVLRKLTDAEMTVYRQPFLKSEDRWPTLTWPRQIPIAGEPADVVAIVDAYAKWMADNDVPKLFVNAEPGAILIGKVREFCRGWKNQTEVTVPGSHFIQEDSGPAIGRAIAGWIRDKRV